MAEGVAQAALDHGACRQYFLDNQGDIALRFPDKYILVHRRNGDGFVVEGFDSLRERGIVLASLCNPGVSGAYSHEHKMPAEHNP